MRARQRMWVPCSFIARSWPPVCHGAGSPPGDWVVVRSAPQEKTPGWSSTAGSLRLPGALSLRSGLSLAIAALLHHVATSRPWNNQAQEANKYERNEAANEHASVPLLSSPCTLGEI